MEQKRLLTTKEAQEYLGISLVYVHYLVGDRQLNPIKVKNRNYFDPDDLNNFKMKRESRKSNKVQPAILN